jgi:PAS domain S-box-containing protein
MTRVRPPSITRGSAQEVHDLRLIVRNQTEFIVRWLPDGTRLWVNPRYCEYFGVTFEQAVGTKFFDLVSEQAVPDILRQVLALTPAQPEMTEIHLAVRGDGGQRWQEWTSRGVFDGRGQLVEVQSSGRDVNERKEAELQLRTALQEFEQLRDQLRAERDYLQDEILETTGTAGLLGADSGLRGVMDQVSRVSQLDTAVLLEGETGTGKELVARTIHAMSRRSAHPLIKVDCGALPASLIEAELFGHERGAFTGAVSARTGRFDLADRGTIFLDEIGELPLDLQVKLLRVLQDGEFERVGSSRTRRVSARCIAATNRDLRACVAQGTFRSDLYYRLAVFPVVIPPLRERRQDIPLLARHFLERASRQAGHTVDSIPPSVMSALLDYEWPGNVRELQSVIERGVILSRGRALDVTGAMLPGVSPPPVGRQTTETFDDVERQAILQALRATGGVVAGAGGAATRLGLKRTTLHSKMKRLGIARPRF